MKREHAKRVAERLSAEAKQVLRCYANRTGGNFSQRAVDEVIGLGLIHQVTNLIDGKDVWVLTADGKKVVKQL